MIPASTHTTTTAPGNPDGVELLARRLTRRAAACAVLAAEVRSTPIGPWIGAAADSFAAEATQASTALHGVADQTALASRVLLVYAEELRAGQLQVRRGQELLAEADRITAVWAATAAVGRRLDPGAEARARGEALVEDGARAVATAADEAARLLDLLIASPADRSAPSATVLDSDSCKASPRPAAPCSIRSATSPPSRCWTRTEPWPTRPTRREPWGRVSGIRSSLARP